MWKPANPMDWEEFEKYMLKQFPFLSRDVPLRELNQNPWFHEFMNKEISSYINKTLNNVPFMNRISYDLHDTLNKIIVKFHIPKNVSRSEMRLSVSRRKVRLRIDANRHQEISLNHPINSKRSHAIFKRDILEVHMPKIREKQNFHDVYIP